MAKSTRNRDEPAEITKSHESTSEKPNLDEDRLNFFLLIILYTLQGFLIGFSNVLPIIVQSKQTVTYDDQALLSIIVWPYALKIIWAPIVDALKIKRIGKRKSWLIPLQLLMVALLLYLSNKIDHWLPESNKPDLKMLVIVTFTLNFLSATQDIVVDGWALTMLKKKNISYAATCNSVGVPIGMIIGSACFNLLVSEKFSTTYLHSAPGSGGIITMKNFLRCWVIYVTFVTVFVGIFKKEKNYAIESYKNINVYQNYRLLWNILKLPGIKLLAIALLTTTFGFIGTDYVSPLKLVDAGVSKDDIIIINTLVYLVKIIMPIFVNKYVTGLNPISYYLKIRPFRLLWGIVFAVFVYFTPRLIQHDGVINVSVYYKLLLGIVYIVNEILSFFMHLTLFAFFCQISDPRYGGMYMTLFNTFYFLGTFVPNSFTLKLVDTLTFIKCSVDVENFCSTSHLKDICKSNGGSCVAYVDGYYIVMAICLVSGFIWNGIFKNVINEYQSKSLFHYSQYDRRLDANEVKKTCITSSA